MEKRRQTKHQNEDSADLASAPGFHVVGFPDDLGIQNVQGRVGAREGPDAFWSAFARLRGKASIHQRLASYVLVEMGPDLETNLNRSAETVVSKRLQFPRLPLVVVGGGHDYAYPWIKAIQKSSKPPKRIACINIDAHLDLRDYRPVMTSGSPFRRLIDEKILAPSGLVEFGIQSHCNSAELWEYCKRNKIRVIPFEDLRNQRSVQRFSRELSRLRPKFDEILISVDLDALSYAFAPGVSAPQAEGLTASELFQILEIAGRDKKVSSIGFFELSPPLDFQNYTARLAAQSAWHFLEAALRSRV